jgi:hypothetical protein
MLGQHPDIYGMPELNLFVAEDLNGLMHFIEGRMPHGGDGLLRALAQLHDDEQTEETINKAQDWINDRLNWSTKRVFDHLRELVEPKLLVDKSPATVMKMDFLERSHAMYPNASYLHLTRHPRSTGKSILALLRRSQDWGGVLDADRVDPERVWYRAHHNILNFTDGLPEGQSMRIKGEDLLAHLDIYLPQIAEWLGVSTCKKAIAQMKHPERSPYACFGPSSAKYGNDPNFLESPSLDKKKRERMVEPLLKGELEWRGGQEFSGTTLKLAKQFGYR